MHPSLAADSRALQQLLIAEPRWSVATAESVTCGHLQAAIGSVSGSSAYFLGGLTAYTLEQKVRLLGVDRDVAAPVNCVSAQVAERMARGACRLFGAEFAVATTGYAEPAPGVGVHSPFAWWAVGCSEEISRLTGASSRVGRVDAEGGGRVETQQRIAAAAIAALVDFLRELRRC